MMDKFQNKYRIQSHRMPLWDYSGNGIYFITIITQNRECNLGEIIKGEMFLSDFGNIVNNEWIKSFEIRRELFCDEYMIMPNHLHAIVILNKSENIQLNGANGLNESHGPDGSHGSHVETHGRASLQSQSQSQSQSPPPPQQTPPPQPEPPLKPELFRKPQSISSFIAGFKSAVNSKIDDFIDDHQLDIPKYNRNNHFFQPNYHDHIIRNDVEYHRIKQYIINNPSNWKDDKFHT